MKIEITFKRSRPKHGCGIDLVEYDDAFRSKLDSFMEDEADQNPDMKPRESEYFKFSKAYRALIRSIEKVLPEDTRGPFTIEINVEGENPDHGPGPRLY